MRPSDLICTDCVEGCRALPDGSVPLTVTSPPYDQIRLYGGHAWDFEALAAELYRVTAPGGVVVWVVQDQIVNGSESGTSARQKLFFLDMGFGVHQTLVMSMSGMRSSPTRYGRAPQYAVIFSKERPTTVNLIRDRQNKRAGETGSRRQRAKDGSLRGEGRFPIPLLGKRSEVWTYNTGYNHTTNEKELFKQHPALMPEKMARDFIVSYSRPGQMVLDPLAGAGTTLKMALLEGRRYLGFEVHPEYAQCGRDRLGRTVEEMLRVDERGVA